MRSWIGAAAGLVAAVAVAGELELPPVCSSTVLRLPSLQAHCGGCHASSKSRDYLFRNYLTAAGSAASDTP